jgi:ATP phosphoribosyltransferase
MADVGVTVLPVRDIGTVGLPPHAGLRVGISNGGALRDAALSVVRKAFGVDASGRRLIHPFVGPVDGLATATIVAARSNDLPHQLADVVVDLAITAHDNAVDAEQPIVPLVDFGLVPGRVVALTIERYLSTWRDRRPIRICSQYPRIAAGWARSLDAPVEVIAVDGAAEVYPHIEVADLIVDNVSSGATAAANSLCEVAFLMDTTLRLYAHRDRPDEPAIHAAAGALGTAAPGTAGALGTAAAAAAEPP